MLQNNIYVSVCMPTSWADSTQEATGSDRVTDSGAAISASLLSAASFFARIGIGYLKYEMRYKTVVPV